MSAFVITVLLLLLLLLPTTYYWAGVVCVWVCYHDNLKMRASIFTKLSL